MLIKNVILAFIGLAGGVTISAGVFAFITAIGIVPRLASRTGTAKYILLYEDCIVWGGVIGNLISIFNWKVPIGITGLLIYAISAGVFVGCLAMALAETLKVIPVFTKRTKITQGMPFVVLAIALGKCLGAFYQLYIH